MAFGVELCFYRRIVILTWGMPPTACFSSKQFTLPFPLYLGAEGLGVNNRKSIKTCHVEFNAERFTTFGELRLCDDAVPSGKHPNRGANIAPSPYGHLEASRGQLYGNHFDQNFHAN